MERAEAIPLAKEPDQSGELDENILTLRAADIRSASYVSLPRRRRFFRERYERFWDYRWEINELFDRLFPGMETLVMYAYASGFSGHVFIKKPSERHPYYVLFTAGMSHVPMKVPKSLGAKRKSFERAELLLFLSPKFSMEGLLPSEFYWIPLVHPVPWKENWFVKLNRRYDRIRFGGYPCGVRAAEERGFWPESWLEKLARMPYKNRTWVHHGTMARDVGRVNTWQASGIFLDFGQLAARNGQIIKLYNCIPLHPEEVEYLTQQRPSNEAEQQAARERILKDLPVLVDLDRPSLCPKEA